MKSVIFLDRDGTINDLCEGFVTRIDEFVFLPRAKEAIKELNTMNIPVIVITNQSCVGRGIITEENLHGVNDFLVSELLESGAHLDALYCCMHRPDENCDCRKPKPGMLDKAALDFDIDFASSWMIGDNAEKDIQMGKAKGCKTILVRTGVPFEEELLEEKPDYIVDDLYEAVQLILGDKGSLKKMSST